MRLLSRLRYLDTRDARANPAHTANFSVLTSAHLKICIYASCGYSSLLVGGYVL